MGKRFFGIIFMTDDGQDELGALSNQRRRVELPARRVAVSWWAIVAAGLCVLQVPMVCGGAVAGDRVLRMGVSEAVVRVADYVLLYGVSAGAVVCGMVGSFWIWRSKGAVRGRRICRLATWGGLVWLGFLLWLSTQKFGNTG